MEKIMILDGNSLVNRAFYALPPLTSPDGLPTNALHGFLTMFFRLLKEQDPNYAVVAFDKTKATVRIEQYAKYKAQRKPTPENLRPQFDYLKEILRVMDVPILELAGYEADDLIAAVAKKGVAAGLHVSVFTGDRDALQLVGPACTVFLTVKGVSEVEVYDEERVWEKYQLKPQQIIDLKGLMGDISDNIPGIPGVGEKTALKLLWAYSSVENVLEHRGEVKGSKLKGLLAQYSEQALLSKKLAAMIDDVPLEFTLEQLRLKEPEQSRVSEVFYRYGLNKIGQLWRSEHKKPAQETAGDEAAGEASAGLKPAEAEELPVQDPAENLWLELFERWQREQRTLTLSYDYQGDVHTGTWEAVGIWDGEGAYAFHRREKGENFLAGWLAVLEDKKVPKVLADSKTLHSLLFAEGRFLNGVQFDVSLAAYLIDPGRSGYGIADLVRTGDEGLFSAGVGVEAQRLGKQTAIYRQKLENLGLTALLEEMEQPVSRVLAEMEQEGIGVEKKLLEEFGRDLDGRLAELEAEIYALSGSAFNINSPQQLGTILFETLGLPPKKKTKTGYSTDADTLEELREEHPIVDKILLHRQLGKLNSTYVRGLLGQLREGKIHTTFQQTVTATGRLSSTEPNLQNIPIRLEEGRKLRKVFRAAKPDWILFSADYSQIELRILAHYSEDPLLCDSFLSGQDVHARTASEVFQVPLAEVTADMRRKAKAVNFGLMYGLTEFGLARDIGVPRKEAKAYMSQYFEKYQGVKAYLDKVVERARETGEVRTLLNRLRRVPELRHGNYMTRQFGARIAMNTPIQGTAADMMKLAMLKAREALSGLPAQMLLQVHDELLIQTTEEALPEVARRVTKAMAEAYPLRVPVVADAKAGPNWYDMKPFGTN